MWKGQLVLNAKVIKISEAFWSRMTSCDTTWGSQVSVEPNDRNRKKTFLRNWEQPGMMSLPVDFSCLGGWPLPGNLPLSPGMIMRESAHTFKVPSLCRGVYGGCADLKNCLQVILKPFLSLSKSVTPRHCLDTEWKDAESQGCWVWNNMLVWVEVAFELALSPQQFLLNASGQLGVDFVGYILREISDRFFERKVLPRPFSGSESNLERATQRVLRTDQNECLKINWYLWTGALKKGHLKCRFLCRGVTSRGLIFLLAAMNWKRPGQWGWTLCPTITIAFGILNFCSYDCDVLHAFGPALVSVIASKAQTQGPNVRIFY